MAELHGIPFLEAKFSKTGVLQAPVAVPPGTTDLIVISHGWRNNEADTRKLYGDFFASFEAIRNKADGRTFAIVGVFWPSTSFKDTVAVGNGGGMGGAAGVGGPAAPTAAEVAQVGAQLDSIIEHFPESADMVEELRDLVPKLERSPGATREFTSKLRGLLDPSEQEENDGSAPFFSRDEVEIFKDLKISSMHLQSAPSAGGAAVVAPAGSPVGVSTAQGGAVGLTDFASGIMAAASNYASYITYYAIKSRAGVVARDGVAPLIDRLAPSVQRVHLIGHSFGGRLVTAAAMKSTTSKLRSVTLLQAAFSHNALSEAKTGFFRTIVSNRRVSGVLAVTHSVKDDANRVAYPLASRISRDAATALGDKKDKFGSIGCNGALFLPDGILDKAESLLKTAREPYQFAEGKVANLNGDTLIGSHGDVTNEACAWAAYSVMTA